MSNEIGADLDLEDVADDVVRELIRRVQDIDARYRAVAEKMGQLYMWADANRLTALTRTLDRPMRNASDNEQTFEAILDALETRAKRRS